jgi:ATP-dependent Clp protease ATP-binding subunit ClpX
MEEIMLDVMYDIPSRNDVVKVQITKDTVEKREPPVVVLQERKGRKREASA